MSFWKFLKCEKSYLYLSLTGFMLIIAVFGTDPAVSFHKGTLLYAFGLYLFLLSGFLAYRYLQTSRVIRHLHDEDGETLSLEAACYRKEMETLEKEHIRALNQVQMKQTAHYNYIVSWFHEIKTPISVLRLLQQTAIDPKSLEEELSRIEHYVDQALYYAKLDSFNQDYEIRNCDLEELVKQLVKGHSKTFISKKIRIHLHVESTIVQSDAKWLHFIVNQLLTNSLQYTGELGEITIAARITQEEKQLIIRDNGIGIDQKDISRIFNRGFTGTNGRTHSKSTGMGLYLAQELSNKLGHYITCTSQAGQYTEMVVHFPKNHDNYLSILAADYRTC
ncbi:MAG: histidine kinase [Paenibacillaceae bacterium]|jgi:signal transduction histidine kinase|nr:histidine kinase [Paenibacillaceae bacterium]